MNFFLYQLQFNTAVHFGSADCAMSLYQSEDHFRADTLFSALCHTALQLEGAAGIQRLIHLVQQGDLLLSDSFPWAEDRFYLPKPIFSPEKAPELPSEKRKALKKLAWIPVEQFDSYCHALKNGTLFAGEAVSFGTALEATKANVPEWADTKPYPVGLYRFREKCGLYVLVSCKDLRDNDWISTLIQALGMSGIGGEVSSGYGKFSVCDEVYLNEFFDNQTQWLYQSLSQPKSSSMLLTTCLPEDTELDTALEGASYQLIRRAGFVASDTYSPSPLKKQTQYFLSAGSVLKNRFSGKLFDVGKQGSHPVFRYAKPIFLGVAL